MRVVPAQAGLLDLVRDVRTEIRRQPLPLAREQAVPLQVAEGAVVGDDLERVVGVLEAPAGLVAPVAARSHDRRGEPCPALG